MSPLYRLIHLGILALSCANIHALASTPAKYVDNVTGLPPSQLSLKGHSEQGGEDAEMNDKMQEVRSLVEKIADKDGKTLTASDGNGHASEALRNEADAGGRAQKNDTNALDSEGFRREQAIGGQGNSFLSNTGQAEDITAECLRIHNLYRRSSLEHPLPVMRRSEAAAQFALQFMKSKADADCIDFSHSSNSGFGENLYGARHASCIPAIEIWYNEINLLGGTYPAIFPAPVQGVGHFTQVVWENSIGLGCARTTSCSGRQFLVCNYSPPGNWVGQRPFPESSWNDMVARNETDWDIYTAVLPSEGGAGEGTNEGGAGNGSSSGLTEAGTASDATISHLGEHVAFLVSIFTFVTLASSV